MCDPANEALSDDGAGPDWSELWNLQWTLRRLARLLASDYAANKHATGEDDPITPLAFISLTDDLREELEVLTERLSTFIGPASDDRDWPTPIAFCLRQIEHDTEAAHRIALAFSNLETSLEIDAAVRLTCAEGLWPGSAATAFAGQEMRAGRWEATGGKWQDVRGAATRLLNRPPPIDDGDDPNLFHLLTLRNALIQPKDTNGLIAGLLKERNDWAHRPPETHAGRRRQAADGLCDRVAQLLWKGVSHLRELPLMVVEGREVGRGATRLRVRPLVGPDPYGRKVVTWDVPRDELPDVADGELCLHHARPFGLISLRPWLIWDQRPDDAHGEPILWLLDGVDAESVRYKSPQAPGVILQRPDLSIESRRFFGCG